MMKTAIEPIRIFDAENNYTWSIPNKQTKAIVAQVSEYWVANVIVPETACRELIQPSFLEPIPTPVGYIISFGAIFMKHSAPTWIPVRMGPASQNCVLSIACKDTRNGKPVTWIDQRYSDNILAEALEKLGFFQVHAKLKVDRSRDMYKHRQLNMYTCDNMLDLCLVEYPEAPPAEPVAFSNASDFEQYYTKGTRSYGPGQKDGHCTMVDLHTSENEHFELMNRYYGYLRTAWGNWKIDGVYRSRNGIYEWQYNGEIPTTEL